MEKMLVTSIFSFSHNVLDHYQHKFQFMSYIYFDSFKWISVNFYAPVSKGRGHIVLLLSICPSLCLSAQT